MVVKKKCPGGLKLLFVPLLLFLFGICISNSEVYASDAFNYSSGDIVNLYTIMRDNSLYYSIENDTNYHDKVIQLWASGDEFMENLSSQDFDLMAEELNSALQQVYINSGEYNNLYGWNTTGMKDSNMWVVVTPTDRTTNPAKICMLFIPAVSNVVTGLENRANVSGDYVYSTTLTINKWNMDHTAVETATSQPYIGIIIDANGYNIYSNKNNSGVPYSTSIGYSLGSAPYWYRRELPNPYDEYNNIMYYIGLVYTHRTNDLFPSLNYKGYNFYSYKEVFNGFRYNLDNGIASSGENIPTPTPVPSGSPGSGSVDLTDTNNLISNVYDALTSEVSSGDFNQFSSGDILDSLDFSETTDPYENFWASFISGLNNALTCPENTTYDIEVFGKNYTIDSSDWAINYPDPLERILIIASTIGIVFAELKMWRKIIIAINTGNLMNFAINYSKSDITDLF